MDMMTNKDIFLDSVTKNDLQTIESWFHDEQFLKYYHYEVIRENSYKDLKKVYLNAEKRNYYPYAIRIKGSSQIIGLTEIFDISKKNQIAWVSVGLGDDKHKGLGYGRKAMEMTIDKAFYELNLRKLQLTVIGYNERAIRLYERLGFTKEGTFRKFVMYDGQEYDLYLYGMLKDEWK